MKKTKVKSAVLPAGWTLPFIFAALAIALALLALPHAGHAQGIVRGAQEGAYEGHRVAGPVGGVVGGAVGAGVGGAMGALRVCSGSPNRTGITIATAISTASAASIATGITSAVIPGRAKHEPGICLEDAARHPGFAAQARPGMTCFHRSILEPVAGLKIHHTRIMQPARKAIVMPTLTATLTSAIS